VQVCKDHCLLVLPRVVVQHSCFRLLLAPVVPPLVFALLMIAQAMSVAVLCPSAADHVATFHLRFLFHCVAIAAAMSYWTRAS
jgi:hypothetical protein